MTEDLKLIRAGRAGRHANGIERRVVPARRITVITTAPPTAVRVAKLQGLNQPEFA